MRPHECDNDECDEEESGWVHVEGCEPMPPLTYGELMQRVHALPPDSSNFLAYMAQEGMI